ncbi:hypothetical protein PYCC9005_000083 [Savitreella phatthalungensis]
MSDREKIATLWAGYGAIYRCKDVVDKSTYIIKRINPPQQSARRGESRDEGDTRKRLSYQVECRFYERYGKSHLDPEEAYHAQWLTPDKRMRDDELALEDLSPRFPKQFSRPCSHAQAKVVVRWLAWFHARHWGSDRGRISTEDSDVPYGEYWRQGGYWYLSTRQEEASTLSPEWQVWAALVDSALARIPSNRQTLIHGDAKAANILFTQDERQCAMYDFQYFGSDSPMRDLAYFVVSSTHRNTAQTQRDLLHLYYFELQAAEMFYNKDITVHATLNQLSVDFELCVLDFWRFMASWGAWGDVDFANEMVRRWCTTKELYTEHLKPNDMTDEEWLSRYGSDSDWPL